MSSFAAKMQDRVRSLIRNDSALVKAAKESGKKHILVTGGCGYIGSHSVLELIEAGYRVTVLDNLDNSSTVSLDRVKELTKCAEHDILFAEVDLMDMKACEGFFARYAPFDACIHFAGLKAVGESVKIPLVYYANNIQGSCNLIHLLDKHECRNVVFSSSATVYGDPEFVPLTEDHPLRSTNAYGKTKLFIEEIFRDVANAKPGWNIALLRYFNPVGGHPSGRMGEDPKGIPNNLVPYVSQVAVGRLPKLSVFGDDWDTPDGTGVRDYIHVVDLAKGHVAAVKKVVESKEMGAVPYNLGTGKGTSVIEVVKAMEKASGREVKYEIAPRREGDIGTCYAEPVKAKEELGWTASIGIDESIADSWKWQSQNPNGYRTEEEIAKGGSEPRKCQVFQMYGMPYGLQK